MLKATLCLRVQPLRQARQRGSSPTGCLRRRQAWQTGPLPKQRCTWAVRAVEGSDTELRKELPIFPLDIVAFPHSPIQLNIFEARYRVLFNTLLAGSEGLEEGLIQYEKPFCGTRQFGMCWMDKDGGLAAIGTLLRIERHSRFSDGKLLVQNLGVQRFRVLKVLESVPVLMCEVELLADNDDDDGSEEVVALAVEVAEAFRDLLQLNHRMGRIQASEDTVVLNELVKMRPRDLSFWIASVFNENRMQQQALLQESSTLERLKQEHHVLSGTVSYLRAKLALQGAFASDPDSSTGSEPPGSGEAPSGGGGEAP